ncbi:PTS sugar transporter subunit IIA [Atopobacter sp. AH10]|uniref:PTS sugar transporter subunit IIA n=1 Tax=Atopobacter sp. AH10 TaxID=2315861 RepID=UPI000EF221AB|nr:PTS sugar transporter subunit IIA [Atopobacter sp. AH10]RLK64145.1 PTS sugar transporter subunit IIA [Atopobacter sp. AH10]
MEVDESHKLFTPDNVSIDFDAATREDAIREAGRLLTNIDSADASYTSAMIRNCEELGPYIVLLPGLALPHAACDNGVKRAGVAAVKLKRSINFGHEENDPVELVIAVASPDSKAHLSLMADLSKLLMDQNSLKALKQANTKDNFLKALNEGGESGK